MLADADDEHLPDLFLEAHTRTIIVHGRRDDRVPTADHHIRHSRTEEDDNWKWNCVT